MTAQIGRKLAEGVSKIKIPNLSAIGEAATEAVLSKQRTIGAQAKRMAGFGKITAGKVDKMGDEVKTIMKTQVADAVKAAETGIANLKKAKDDIVVRLSETTKLINDFNKGIKLPIQFNKADLDTLQKKLTKESGDITEHIAEQTEELTILSKQMDDMNPSGFKKMINDSTTLTQNTMKGVEGTTKGTSMTWKRGAVYGAAAIGTAAGIHAGVTGQSFKESNKEVMGALREEVLTPVASVTADTAAEVAAVGIEATTTVIKATADSSGPLFNELGKGISGIGSALGLGLPDFGFGDMGGIIYIVIIFAIYYIYSKSSQTTSKSVDTMLYN